MALPSLPQSLGKPRRELTKLWLRVRAPLLIVVAAVGVLGGAFLGWQAWSERADESRQQETESAARAVVEAVGAALAQAVAPVDAASADAALAALLAEGDPAALRATEERLAAAVPRALGVRLLTREAREDYASRPPVTYAALEMMRAAADGETPDAEVLLLGEADQHIAVLRAVSADGAGTPLGFVLAGLEIGVLAEAVDGAALPAGYVELSQIGARGGLAAGRKGNAIFKSGPPTVTLPVPGSTLRVHYWSEAVRVEAPPSELPVVPIAAGAVLVLALAAVVLARVRKSRAAAGKKEPPPRPRADPAQLAQKLQQPESAEQSEDGEAEDAAVPTMADQVGAVTEISPEIFRAYDVRGVVDESLTSEVVKLLGLAIGSEAYDRGQQTICVGRDGRASSPGLAAALIEGLRASGRDVIDVGQVATPVLYFATYYLETGSGVMITGSHNPPQYNGLKIMLGEETLFGDDIQALLKRIQEGTFTTGAGNLQSIDVSADYIRRIGEDVPVALGNAFKVVIDCGNGVAGDYAPKLIRALGHDVVELYCEVDGSFPNHHPDPSQPENLRELIAAVREHDADLGFAFDGDGDRLGVVDGSGRIVWPDVQMMLFARDVISRNAGAEIVFDVKCSSRLARVVEKLGGKPVMFKTGHSYIKNKLKETGAPLAGEMSGHIFFKERWYGFDDAMYAAARMLEILMGFKQRPEEVFAKLPVGVSTPELRVDMEEGENLRFMEELEQIDRFGDAVVTTIDGVRVDWKDRWGLVRASNTTPSLVLRFEGDDEQALERVKETFRELLLEKKPDLSLPF